MASVVRRRPAALRRRDDRTRVLAAVGGRGLARGGPGLGAAPGRGGADLDLRRGHAAVARGRASLAAAIPPPGGTGDPDQRGRTGGKGGGRGRPHRSRDRQGARPGRGGGLAGGGADGWAPPAPPPGGGGGRGRDNPRSE